MKLFIPEVTTPDWMDPCVGALVSFTREYVERIQRRRAAMLWACCADTDLVEMYFNERSVRFLKAVAEDDPSVARTAADLVHGVGSRPGLLASVDEPLREHPSLLTESPQLGMSQYGVFWLAYPKYGTGELRTELITWETFGQLRQVYPEGW